jgi:hypothetical protein
MKNLRLFGFLMLLASSSLFINCTSDPIQGPAGVAGADGTDGVDGVDGVDSTTDCRACHSFEYREPIQEGYAMSKHATGDTWESRGKSESCAQCHNNEGFIDFQNTGAVHMDGYVISNPITCTGCHNEHRSFNFDEDGNDFALRTIDPVTLIVDSEETLDLANESDVLGLSNLCVNCHQPRTALPEDDGMGNYEITSSHWGTHHNPQSTMLEGIQGVLLPGSVSYPARASSTHRMESSCVNCHMAESSVASTGDHTFNPTLDACISCHDGATTFDVNGFQTEVEDQLVVLAGLLAQVPGIAPDGTTPITGIVINDDPIEGTFPIIAAGAAWNYIFVFEDKSKGVHNPAMVEALLQNSIETLQNP